jgi:hypothetical protein
MKVLSSVTPLPGSTVEKSGFVLLTRMCRGTTQPTSLQKGSRPEAAQAESRP